MDLNREGCFRFISGIGVTFAGEGVEGEGQDEQERAIE